MTSTREDRIGSRTALLIGLPIGLMFSFTILVISLFPMVDIGLAAIGGRLFWHPIIWAGLIPIIFTFLLWKAGQRINVHLDKNYSVIKISFLFTLFINSRLFTLILLIFLIGGLFSNVVGTFSLFSFGVALGLTIFTFITATVFTTFTVGMLIVTIAKRKIYR